MHVESTYHRDIETVKMCILETKWLKENVIETREIERHTAASSEQHKNKGIRRIKEIMGSIQRI
jgi:hypothetical protein